MVAASQVYHSKVAHTIQAMAMLEAKKAVRRRLQAEGRKISWYSTKEITIMAHALLEERRDEFIAKAKASAVVQEVREECGRRERRRLERKSKSYVQRRSRRVAGTFPERNLGSKGRTNDSQGICPREYRWPNTEVTTGGAEGGRSDAGIRREAIGQSRHLNVPGGAYVITATLPEREDKVAQFAHDRVVTESELSATP
jgi:hypothetical protein